MFFTEGLSSVIYISTGFWQEGITGNKFERLFTHV